jgi:hypothetical protein
MVLESGVCEPLPVVEFPFDCGFYERLVAERDGFRLVFSHVVPARSGYGFRVEAGQSFRLVMIQEAQILDTCMLSSEDPTEHLYAPAQMAIEGAVVTRFTRVWGNPPRSRPIATCIADTVRLRPNDQYQRDHCAHGAHCNPHLWYLFTGQHHRWPCYDNLREGFAMLGLSQRAIHDNVNLFMKSGIDPGTGSQVLDRSDAQPGDYMEFYAEIPMACVISTCPSGSGSHASSGTEATWDEIPVYPVGVEIYDTDIKPQPWPTE